MRIVVSGGRDITDKKTVEKVLSGEIAVKDVVITGGCSGVDKIAHDYARRYFADTEVHKADWDKHGKAAGPIRNAKMMEDADLLIAFWDGRSKGTRSAIDEARKLGVETHIHYIKPPKGGNTCE